MPAPKIPAIQADPALLVEPFAEKAKHLILAVDHAGLPMVVFETRRAIARQDWLADKGYSKAHGLSGPHCWGLAIDMVLDPKASYWRGAQGQGQWPQKVGGGAAWDTGFELRADGQGQHLVLVRPAVAAVWRLYGQLAESLGLTWGGRNTGDWASPVAGAEFGWDPAHVQLHGWRATAKTLPKPKE